MGFRAVKRLRYRVVPRSTPGVAAEYATESQPSAFEGSVLLDGFHRVLRAGGGVAAGGRGEGGNAVAVEPNQAQHHFGNAFGNQLPPAVHTVAQPFPKGL